jgi:hypothetical protein
MENIRQIMQATYPAADLSRYFAFLAQATGSDHKHHVAPQAEFPELARAAKNIVPLSYQEHFYAHYLLALAVPECVTFQTTVWLIANTFADKIRTDELPHFAEVYERGMMLNPGWSTVNSDTAFTAKRIARLNAKYSDPAIAAARVALSKEKMCRLNSDPEFIAANADRTRKRHADSEFAARHAERVREQLHIKLSDPVFAAEQSARGRKTMKRLHHDPIFAASNSEIWKKLNADPLFAAARDARGHETMMKLHADPLWEANNNARLKKLRSDPVFEAARAFGNKKFNHRRWHVNRGIINPNCEFCIRKGQV